MTEKTYQWGKEGGNGEREKERNKNKTKLVLERERISGRERINFRSPGSCLSPRRNLESFPLTQGEADPDMRE